MWEGWRVPAERIRRNQPQVPRFRVDRLEQIEGIQPEVHGAARRVQEADFARVFGWTKRESAPAGAGGLPATGQPEDSAAGRATCARAERRPGTSRPGQWCSNGRRPGWAPAPSRGTCRPSSSYWWRTIPSIFSAALRRWWMLRVVTDLDAALAVVDGECQRVLADHAHRRELHLQGRGAVVAVGEQQELVGDIIADHADGVGQLGQKSTRARLCPAPRRCGTRPPACRPRGRRRRTPPGSAPGCNCCRRHRAHRDCFSRATAYLSSTGMGTPPPSTSNERLVPCLLRSTGEGPVFFPRQGSLGHRAIPAHPGPVDASEGVVGGQPCLPKA